MNKQYISILKCLDGPQKCTNMNCRIRSKMRMSYSILCCSCNDHWTNLKDKANRVNKVTNNKNNNL